MCPVPHVSSDNSGYLSGQPSHGPEPVDILTQLLAALLQQTHSINRLADSNMALVRAMAEADGMDDAMPTSYMDGSPVR